MSNYNNNVNYNGGGVQLQEDVLYILLLLKKLLHPFFDRAIS